MAPTALTPLAIVTSDQPHASNNDESPFLKLAPELRNRIYDLTFKAAGVSGPVPHALTRVNRQIRSECRAMYYASIKYLKIRLYTLAQIECTKRWLAEEDWSWYPVLPNIVFGFWVPSLRSKIAVALYRKEANPSEESSRRLSLLSRKRLSHEEKLKKATFDTYIYYLGLNPKKIALVEPVGERFTGAIKEGATWSIRLLKCNRPESFDLLWNDPGLYKMFFKLAVRKQGSELNEDDLKSIVQWMERYSRYRQSSELSKTATRSGRIRE